MIPGRRFSLRLSNEQSGLPASRREVDLPRIPDLPRIVGRAQVGPGGVDEPHKIVLRAPVEVELGARIVEPIGMIGAGDVDRPQAPRRLEMSGDGGIVDGLVHRDVVKLAPRRRIVEGGEDGVDEVVDMNEIALERAPVRVAQQGMVPSLRQRSATSGATSVFQSGPPKTSSPNDRE